MLSKKAFMKKTKLMEEVEKTQGRSIIKILREELAKKQRRSYKEIAKDLGVDRTTIANWVKKFNQVYEGCLSICFCRSCKKRYNCERFEKSHSEGYCILACVHYEKSK